MEKLCNYCGRLAVEGSTAFISTKWTLFVKNQWNSSSGVRGTTFEALLDKTVFFRYNLKTEFSRY